MDKFMFLFSDEAGQVIWLLSLERDGQLLPSILTITQKLPKNISLKSLF